jgi:RNA polymerase sigma-70 factor, ECF subfamily
MAGVATTQRQENIKPYSEQELILQCQAGKVAAFREVYNLHSTLLYSIAFRLLGKKEDAEDALQNTFSKLYKNIGQFRFQSKFSSYLVRILINGCYDIIEKRKHDFEPLENFELGQANQTDLKLSLEKAIACLPLKMRESFILFAVEGFKQSEIAEVLEISEGTVKAHIFQARAKLKELLQE